MKKKKILILVVVILIIIGVVVTAIMMSKNKDQKTDYLKKVYDKLLASQEYSFKMEKNDTNKTTMAKKGEQTSIDQYSDEEGHLTTLI